MFLELVPFQLPKSFSGPKAENWKGRKNWRRLLFLSSWHWSSWKSRGLPWPGSQSWHTLLASLSTEGETGWWLALSGQKPGLSGAGVPFSAVVVLCRYHQLYRQTHLLQVDIFLHISYKRERVWGSKALTLCSPSCAVTTMPVTWPLQT